MRRSSAAALMLVAAALPVSMSCAPAPAAPPPEDSHPDFDFLLRASAAAPGSSAPPVPTLLLSALASRPPASASSSIDDPYAGCRQKMGSSLAVKLAAPASGPALVKVTVEFSAEQDDDAVPGLGFIRPGVAVGALTPRAIAKLCQHADLKWIDATPTFMGP